MAAVAHVLLSRLCRQVGYEMYEMDIADRNLLLRELKEAVGQERFDSLGEFLLDYVAQRLTDDDADTRDLRESQEWTALVYTKPHEAAQELAQRLSEEVQQENIGEVLRIASLIEVFSERLVETGFKPLLVYADGISHFVKGNLETARNKFRKLLEKNYSLEIAGVILPIPEQIKQNDLEHTSQKVMTYEIRLDGDLLRVRFTIPAHSEQILKDAAEQLESMINSGQIPGNNSILKIDGPQSIAIAYLISHKLSHLYETIAIYDPKLGKNGYKTYIVAISNSTKYKVGDLIETQQESQIISSNSILKVVLCGSTNSGKSVFREGLKTAILNYRDAPYPYVIIAYPYMKNEYMWFSKEYNSKELDNFSQSMSGDQITLEFADKAAQWVRSSNVLISIIDVGSKISEENRVIMSEATHAVILSVNPNDFNEWEDFCQSIGLKIIAKINSQFNASEDKVFLVSNWKNKTRELLNHAPLLTGIIHSLEQGQDISNRPVVKSLAEILIHLTKC